MYKEIIINNVFVCIPKANRIYCQLETNKKLNLAFAANLPCTYPRGYLLSYYYLINVS